MTLDELVAMCKGEPDKQRLIKLTARAMAYMAECMAMPDSADDQEQNWILGHLVTFADRELTRAKR